MYNGQQAFSLQRCRGMHLPQHKYYLQVGIWIIVPYIDDIDYQYEKVLDHFKLFLMIYLVIYSSTSGLKHT